MRVRDKGRSRLGTRVVTDEGDVSVLELIEAAGGTVTDGLVPAGPDGAKMPFLWTFTPGSVL